MANEKEPFVSKGDRPEVNIKPDQRIAELSVRDLGALLGEHATLILKRWKEFKQEKWEHPKIEKIEKWEHPKWEKIEKFEKYEKIEQIKREKNEKIEIDIYQIPQFEPRPDPTGPIGPDPIQQLVATVSKLGERVAALDAAVAELKGKIK
jgi:hypothetical protein